MIEDNNTNEFVDKVTLELLMNKNHYNRYISQTDPKKHQEQLAHMEKIKKYKNMILEITEEFLDNPYKQVTTEVNEAFDSYVRTLIRHYEYNQIEHENSNSNEEDVLFGTMDGTETYKSSVNRSFWGKNKVVKKNSATVFPINYIPRIKEKTDL